MEDTSSETSKSLISIPSSAQGGIFEPPKASSLKDEAQTKITPGPKCRSLPPSRSTATTQASQPKASIAPLPDKEKPPRSDLIAQQAAQEAELREAHAKKEKERALRKEAKAAKKGDKSQETKTRKARIGEERVQRDPKAGVHFICQVREGSYSVNATLVAFEKKEKDFFFPIGGSIRSNP